MDAVELIRLAAANGIWSVLFVFLFLYQLKDSRAREKKYQETIQNLSTSLEAVHDIKQDLAELKDSVDAIPRSKPRKAKEVKNAEAEV